jgi:hypothetical protein
MDQFYVHERQGIMLTQLLYDGPWLQLEIFQGHIVCKTHYLLQF